MNSLLINIIVCECQIQIQIDLFLNIYTYLQTFILKQDKKIQKQLWWSNLEAN